MPSLVLWRWVLLRLLRSVPLGLLALVLFPLVLGPRPRGPFARLSEPSAPARVPHQAAERATARRAGYHRAYERHALPVQPARPGDIYASVASTVRAKKRLGFKIEYPFEKGLALTYRWYLQQQGAEDR